MPTSSTAGLLHPLTWGRFGSFWLLGWPTFHPSYGWNEGSVGDDLGLATERDLQTATPWR